MRRLFFEMADVSTRRWGPPSGSEPVRCLELVPLDEAPHSLSAPSARRSGFFSETERRCELLSQRLDLDPDARKRQLRVRPCRVLPLSPAVSLHEARTRTPGMGTTLHSAATMTQLRPWCDCPRTSDSERPL